MVLHAVRRGVFSFNSKIIMETIKKIFSGSALAFCCVFLISGPIWFILTVLNIRAIHYPESVILVLYLVFLISALMAPVYYLMQRKYLASFAALVGGVLTLALLLFIMIGFSCSHGVCM